MKAVITKINLEGIGEHDARELLAELNKLDLAFKHTEFPRLYEFQRILTGCFSSMVHDVHYISKRESESK